MEVKVIDTELLIIGSGGAGLRAAIEAHDNGAKVLVIGKCRMGNAHTKQAEGGINAALGNVDSEDNWEIHFRDTEKEGHNIGNARMIEILCKEAPERILELQKWGVSFHRTKDGKIDQRPFGAQTYRRTCFSGDKIGLEIMNALVRQTKKRKIKFMDGIFVTSVLKKGNRAVGVTAVKVKTGEFFAIRAKAIILATGGFTRIYKISTHEEPSYGDGIVMAYNAGVELADMEMIQFHPTGMVWPEEARGTLVTEAVRGEGGRLFNSVGERFMPRYDPDRMELGARDVVARANYHEIKARRGTKHGGVWLDITHIDSKIIKKKLPRMYRQFKKFGNIDITKHRMEVAPTAHYTMSGIISNPETTETGISGLFVAGEASVGVHGANRLGGNSLAETQVFGKRAGEFAGEYAKKEKLPALDKKEIEKEYERITFCFGVKKSVKPSELREQLRETMWKYAGIERAETSLKKGLVELENIKEQIGKTAVKGNLKSNKEWVAWMDLHNMLICSEAVIRAALMRTESRGAHYRADFLEKDEGNWRANIVCSKKNGRMHLEKRMSPQAI